MEIFLEILTVLKDAGVTLMIIALMIKAKTDIKHFYAYASFILILLLA